MDYTVTDYGDSGPGTLRALVAAARNGDSVTVRNSGMQNTITPTTNITIDGGAGTNIVAGGSTQLFIVTPAVSLTLRNLVLLQGRSMGNGGAIADGGTLTLTTVRFSGNQANGNGGAVSVAAGATLTTTGTTFDANGAFGDGGAVSVAAGGTFIGLGDTLSNNFAANGGAVANAGTVTLTNASVRSNNTASNTTGAGGAIDSSGTLTLQRSSFSSNTAGAGGAVRSTGTLTVQGCSFSTNQANAGDGGAVLSTGAATFALPLNSLPLSFTGNSASGAGGAIAESNTGPNPVTITAATFTNNTGGTGGGAISYTGGTLIVTASTVSGNTATTGNGGGILMAAPFTLTNVTVSGNTAAAGSGGGVEDAAAATITATTITGNTATGAGSSGGGIGQGGASPTLALTLALVAGNSAANGATDPDLAGSVDTDGGGNVVGIAAGGSGLTAATDRTGTAVMPLDAKLGPLADNGGPVQTQMPGSGSPALDIVPCPAGLTQDARGISRPQGSACDAGAVEVRTITGTTFIVTRAADDADDTNCNAPAFGGCTLRQAVNLVNMLANSGTSTITFAADFTGANAITVAGKELDVYQSVTVDATVGNRAVTISGGGTTQLFFVSGRNRQITLRGLTLTGGNATELGGGALNVVSNARATVTLDGVTLTDNTSSGVVGGGAVLLGNEGMGAIGTTLTVTRSVFTRNTETREFGGGVIKVTFGATVTVRNSLFTDNTAASGGAILSSGGAVTVVNSTFTRNAGGLGGALLTRRSRPVDRVYRPPRSSWWVARSRATRRGSAAGSTALTAAWCSRGPSWRATPPRAASAAAAAAPISPASLPTTGAAT